jgi:hypothetical protein
MLAIGDLVCGSTMTLPLARGWRRPGLNSRSATLSVLVDGQLDRPRRRWALETVERVLLASAWTRIRPSCPRIWAS